MSPFLNIEVKHIVAVLLSCGFFFKLLCIEKNLEKPVKLSELNHKFAKLR